MQTAIFLACLRPGRSADVLDAPKLVGLLRAVQDHLALVPLVELMADELFLAILVEKATFLDLAME